MFSGTDHLPASAILAAAKGARAEENAAAARVLTAAVEWAHLHTVTDLDDAATWWSGSRTLGQDTGIPIAGTGCPLVSEFAVAEFATTLGMAQDSGRHLIGQAPSSSPTASPGSGRGSRTVPCPRGGPAGSPNTPCT
jgi:hypothetical protein